MCAAVSRQWQYHVEKQTFALLRLDPERVLAARDILIPVRQSYVRCIGMDALLPEYDAPKLWMRPETDKERQQNNQAFTRAIIGLFECLSYWEPSITGAGVVLELYALSPADKRDIAMPFSLKMRKKRWQHSSLSLKVGAEDDLPTLYMITKFIIPQPHILERRVAARVCGVMASRMSNLAAVDWNLEDNEKEDIYLRQRMRQEFATSLANLP